MPTRYICKNCDGQTLFKEICVFCGSGDFREEEFEIKKTKPTDRKKKKGFGGTHFGKEYDGFCLEL